MDTIEAIRTNYFHVRNPDAFLELMDLVICDDAVEVWQKTDEHGETMFGFGVYGDLVGIPDEGSDLYDDNAYDNFVVALQECVAIDDAIIIMHIGFQGLRDLFGYAYIVTSDGTDYVDLQDAATDCACKMLKEGDWNTICQY